MYAHDNADLVPLNLGHRAQANWETWVRGVLSLDFGASHLGRPVGQHESAVFGAQSPLPLCVFTGPVALSG